MVSGIGLVLEYSYLFFFKHRRLFLFIFKVSVFITFGVLFIYLYDTPHYMMDETWIRNYTETQVRRFITSFNQGINVSVGQIETGEVTIRQVLSQDTFSSQPPKWEVFKPLVSRSDIAAQWAELGFDLHKDVIPGIKDEVCYTKLADGFIKKNRSCVLCSLESSCNYNIE